jgi:anaerobic magnesium-protoporphyrin IX monomethyl ester cyclase
VKVLVGQSYYLRFDEKLWRAMRPHPPLGSLYAASVLRDAGHDVTVFDAMLATSEADWGAAVARVRPDVAVIFEDNFNYLSKMCLLRMREAAFRMLAMAKTSGCTTIVCGSDATDHAHEYLSSGADLIVLGEGENTLAELTGVLAAGDPIDEVVGVSRLDADGLLRSTGRRANQRDLDALPFPAWDLVDLQPYRLAWARHGRFSLNMVTTRGCPFSCNWCAKPIWGQRYAVRSPEHVVAELAMLRERYAPDHISFADDIFGLRPGWIPVYARLVRERDLVVPFSCLSRADLLTRDGEVEALRDAGCETVWMGAESGAQSILDAMDKGTRVEQIEDAASRLRAAGIGVGFFLQFGYPGEGPAEIEATRELVRRCRPDDIGISVSYPLPGTGFYEQVREQMAGKQNWVDSDDLSMLYEGPFSTEVYRTLHRVVHRELRLRQAAASTSIVRHAMRPARRPLSRSRWGRVRDAVTLPWDERALRRRMAAEQGARPPHEAQTRPGLQVRRA